MSQDNTNTEAAQNYDTKTASPVNGILVGPGLSLALRIVDYWKPRIASFFKRLIERFKGLTPLERQLVTELVLVYFAVLAAGVYFLRRNRR